MPRPRKWRRVCGLPGADRFGPLNEQRINGQINMTLDEYETIRLIDLEGLTQEACAKQMEVARTTVQGIYDTARHKVAQALVNGQAIFIAGGDYQLCDGRGEGCYRGHCNRGRFKGNNQFREDL